MSFFKMYNDQNLLHINAIDKFRYCAKILDVLFTREELKEGAVEPTGIGKYKALDEAKIQILKSKLI